jgi:hypothetical protein
MTTVDVVDIALVEVPTPTATAGSSPSAVTWGAIVAGAVVAAATSLVLIILGSGFGLALASPWSAPSVTSFTIMAGIWFIVVQWAASGVGGYITGRLRTRWIGTHTHEVFFRDTAHGFIAWALSTVLVAVVLIAAGSMAAGAAARDTTNSAAVSADALFRSATPDANPAAGMTRMEAERIVARATVNGGLAPEDRHYLGQLVAARTGLTQADAEARVDTVVIAAKTAADDARKAASATSIITALAMLIGAFIASVAAALGGQLRDGHP